MKKATYTYLAGKIPPGAVKRTVEAAPGILVDADADGKPLGVEVTGDGDWRDGLAALAAAGRLRVMPGWTEAGAPKP